MIFDLRWKQNLGLVVLKSQVLMTSFMAVLNSGQSIAKQTQKGLKLVNLPHPEQLKGSGSLALQPKDFCSKNRVAEEVQRPKEVSIASLAKAQSHPAIQSKTQSPAFVALPVSEGQSELKTLTHNDCTMSHFFWPRVWVSSEPPVHTITSTGVIILYTRHRCDILRILVGSSFCRVPYVYDMQAQGNTKQEMGL